jgi:hypothetical protein
MRRSLKHLCWIAGVVFFAASAQQHGMSISIFLNDHTIPFINTDKPANEIVNAAYAECSKVLKQWDEEHSSLPQEMVAKQNAQYHAFYVHMIEVRRKYSEKK